MTASEEVDSARTHGSWDIAIAPTRTVLRTELAATCAADEQPPDRTEISRNFPTKRLQHHRPRSGSLPRSLRSRCLAGGGLRPRCSPNSVTAGRGACLRKTTIRHAPEPALHPAIGRRGGGGRGRTIVPLVDHSCGAGEPHPCVVAPCSRAGSRSPTVKGIAGHRSLRRSRKVAQSTSGLIELAVNPSKAIVPLVTGIDAASRLGPLSSPSLVMRNPIVLCVMSSGWQVRWWTISRSQG